MTKVFRLSDEMYQEIKVLLNRDMDRGLQRATHNSATVKMFHTHVRALPNGSGQYSFNRRHAEFLSEFAGRILRLLPRFTPVYIMCGVTKDSRDVIGVIIVIQYKIAVNRRELY